MTPSPSPYHAWINPELPDIVRFARERELKEMEQSGVDLQSLTPPEPPVSPHPSKALPDLVRFAREREDRLPKRSLEQYLSPWDGLSNNPFGFFYHHAEPLMPLRGRDLDVMDTFFSEAESQGLQLAS
jgi:hypothetical protein